MIEKIITGNIETLKMDNDKMNTLDIDFCRELTLYLDKAEQSDIKALILTGKERVFSAGVNLLKIIDQGNAYLEGFIPALTDLFVKLFTFQKPLIAAINGHAIAGGCIMALTADFRIMASGEGRMGVPERMVGVPFPSIAMEIIRFSVAPKYFQKIIYSGATFKPQESLELGLIEELASFESLQAEAIKNAEKMAAIPEDVFILTKQQVRQPTLDRVKEQDKYFKEKIRAIWLADSTRQSIEAYVKNTFKKGK